MAKILAKPPSSVSISTAASGDTTLVTAQTGQTVRVLGIILVSAGAVNVTIKDGASTSLTGAMTMATGSSIILPRDGLAWFTTSAGNALILNLSGAVQVSGRLYYVQS